MKHQDILQRDLNHELDSIYLVESLSDGELRTGRLLYDDVVEPLAADYGLHAKFVSSRTKGEFLIHLQEIAEEVQANDLRPILHIDAHGSPSGLGLADGSHVPWEALRDSLGAINLSSRFNLLVVLAACSGIYLQRAVSPELNAPVWGLIGPTEAVPAGEIEVRFQRFYREYLVTVNPRAAMEALNGSPVGSPWTYGFRSAANLFRESWRGYILGFLDPSQSAARFGEFVTVSSSLLDLSVADHRRLAKSVLLAKEFFLETFATRFFMYDLLPENQKRFPIPINRMIEEVKREWAAD